MALDATGTPTSILSIPKYNTAVDPPSGKGFNAAMDYIDTIINAHTGVNSAGTTILGNKLLTADAQPAFTIKGDGSLSWGAGGASVPEITLRRSAANYMTLDSSSLVMEGTLWTELPAASDAAVATYVTGSDTRFMLKASGAMEWGDGTPSRDTYLSRSGAGYLKTDDHFVVGNNLFVDNDGAGSPIYFGSGADVNLYRSAANVLKTDDQFHIGNAAGLKFNDGTTMTTAPVIASSVPSGLVAPFAGSSAPSGWLFCDGSSVATATYPDLFTAIGYQYGGAGANFNLPDLRQRVAVGKHSSGTFATLGATGGAETVTLTTAMIPAHSHAITAGSVVTDINWTNRDDAGCCGANSVVDLGETKGATATASDGGTGGSHTNLQPYIVLNSIIKT